MKIGGFFIVAVLALTACSGDPQPREPDPSATPTSTSTATPPPMPDQATEDSPEGAAAFVDYWVDVSNYAAATGDVTELSRISSADCSGCQSYIDLYRDTYAAGGYFKGGDWELGAIDVEYSPDNTYVTTTVEYSVGKFLSANGDKVRTMPSDSDQVSFAIQTENGSKRISQLGLGDVQ